MLKGHESARVTGEDVVPGRNSIYKYKQENGRSSYFRRTQAKDVVLGDEVVRGRIDCRGF